MQRVVRKDQAGYPEEGFQMENAISREEALRAMTIWAARSGFEEDLKGSIEARETGRPGDHRYRPDDRSGRGTLRNQGAGDLFRWRAGLRSWL